MSNEENIKQYLGSQINKLFELKQELNSREEELDKIFKRRTEIHEGAPAKEGEVEELDKKFLECSDEINKIGDKVKEIQENLDGLI